MVNRLQSVSVQSLLLPLHWPGREQAPPDSDLAHKLGEEHLSLKCSGSGSQGCSEQGHPGQEILGRDS